MDKSWHPEHFQCYGCLVVFSDNMSYREKVRCHHDLNEWFYLVVDFFETLILAGKQALL